MSRDFVEEAEALEASGQFAKAIERWRSAAAAEPQPETLARLGRLCAYHGDAVEGERILRETILAYPQFHGTYFYLAVHLRHQQKFKEAQTLLERSVQLRPDTAPTFATAPSRFSWPSIVR